MFLGAQSLLGCFQDCTIVRKVVRLGDIHPLACLVGSLKWPAPTQGRGGEP